MGNYFSSFGTILTKLSLCLNTNKIQAIVLEIIIEIDWFVTKYPIEKECPILSIRFDSEACEYFAIFKIKDM